jgi:hypothetical protein
MSKLLHIAPIVSVVLLGACLPEASAGTMLWGTGILVALSLLAYFLAPKFSRVVRSIHGSTKFQDNVDIGGNAVIDGTLTVTGALTSTTTALGGATEATLTTDSSGDISAASMVVAMDKSSQARLGRAVAQYSDNIIGVSTAAEAAGSVAAKLTPGTIVAEVTGTVADTKYYAGVDGDLIAESAIEAELVNTGGKKLQVGYTDASGDFIFMPKVEENVGEGVGLWCKFDRHNGITPIAGHMYERFLRGSEASYWDNGILKIAARDCPRIETDSSGVTTGLRIEGGATNHCHVNRDMSNVAWTKSNITAARDATGIDGVANSASTLTATATDGTCTGNAMTSLNSVVAVYSIYMKRKTGTGTISVSVDGGATYNTATVTSTTEWTRYQWNDNNAAAQIVIKIGTSGDELECDFAQGEIVATNSTSAYCRATSPIWTRTAGAVTRSPDYLSYNMSGPVSGLGMTVYMELIDAFPMTSLSEVPIIFEVGSSIYTAFFDGSTDNTTLKTQMGGSTAALASAFTEGQTDSFTLSMSNTSPQVQVRRLTNTKATDTEVRSTYLTTGNWEAFSGEQICIGLREDGSRCCSLLIKEIKILNHFVSSAYEDYLLDV